MKASTVRGTPVRSATVGNEGQMASKPAHMMGTSPSQYVGDQSNRIDARSGTQYNSVNGNPATAKSVKQSGGIPIVLSENGINMNEPESNGNGVLFDNVSAATGFRANPQPSYPDSPVPMGAQKPIQNAPDLLANMRSGVGAVWGPDDGPGNNFQTMGGVMSRGMLGTSTPSGGEKELTKDDTL